MTVTTGQFRVNKLDLRLTMSFLPLAVCLLFSSCGTAKDIVVNVKPQAWQSHGELIDVQDCCFPHRWTASFSVYVNVLFNADYMQKRNYKKTYNSGKVIVDYENKDYAYTAYWTKLKDLYIYHKDGRAVAVTPSNCWRLRTDRIEHFTSMGFTPLNERCVNYTNGYFYEYSYYGSEKWVVPGVKDKLYSQDVQVKKWRSNKKMCSLEKQVIIDELYFMMRGKPFGRVEEAVRTRTINMMNFRAQYGTMKLFDIRQQAAKCLPSAGIFANVKRHWSNF